MMLTLEYVDVPEGVYDGEEPVQVDEHQVPDDQRMDHQAQVPVDLINQYSAHCHTTWLTKNVQLGR